MDATYEPVDGIKNIRERNAVIERDYPLLVAALDQMLPDKTVPIIVVKVNVCDVLDSRLTSDGINVLNKGLRVHFPACGGQPIFREQFPRLLKSAGLAG